MRAPEDTAQPLVLANQAASPTDCDRRRLAFALLGTLGGAALLEGCAGGATPEHLEQSTNALVGTTYVIWCDNYTDLRGQKGGTSASSKNAVVVRGYSSPGDSGGGVFVWSSNTVVADNGGTVIVPTGTRTGCWMRLYSGSLDPRWFGAKGDGTTDDRAAVNATANAVPAAGGSIVLPPGTYRLASALSLPPNVTLVGAGGRLNPAAGTTLTVSGSVVAGEGTWIFDIPSGATLLLPACGFVNVGWFGAKGDDSTDNSHPLQVALAVGLPVKIPKGVFRYSTELTLPTGAQLIGAGKNSSVLRYTGTANAISYTYLNTCARILIQDLSVVAAAAQNIVKLVMAWMVRLDRVLLDGGGSGGVNSGVFATSPGTPNSINCSQVWVYDSEIQGMAGVGVKVLDPCSAAGIWIVGCQIQTCGSHGVHICDPCDLNPAWAGIRSQVHVIRCVIEANSGYGIQDDVSHGSRIEECCFEENALGHIRLGGDNRNGHYGAPYATMICSNNFSGTGGDYHIDMICGGGVEDTTIDGNVFAGKTAVRAVTYRGLVLGAANHFYAYPVTTHACLLFNDHQPGLATAFSDLGVSGVRSFTGPEDWMMPADLTLVFSGSANATVHFPCALRERAARTVVNNSSCVVTIVPSGSDTINGSTSLTLLAQTSVTLVSNDTGWIRIACSSLA